MPTPCPQKSTAAFDLIFLGTGSSGSLPNISCLTAPPDEEQCQTCLSTRTPAGKKNERRNTSAVVRIDGIGGKKTILIDTGKNFHAAAIKWFQEYDLRRIDAVLLTHGHADAINGLDDLRAWTLDSAIQPHIDIYLSRETFEEVQKAFPYLVSKDHASGGGGVPAFKWHIIKDNAPFEIEGTGIQVLPLSVHHGRYFSTPPNASAQVPAATLDTPPPTRSCSPAPLNKVTPYLANGFLIQDSLIYMSDVSFVPEKTWNLLEESRKRNGQPSVAVVDCLRPTKHPSHFGLKEAVSTARRIGAVRTYCVGFEHEVTHASYEKIFGALDGQDHRDELSAVERQGFEMIEPGNPIWIRPAYDGLKVTALGGGIVKDHGH